MLARARCIGTALGGFYDLASVFGPASVVLKSHWGGKDTKRGVDERGRNVSGVDWHERFTGVRTIVAPTDAAFVGALTDLVRRGLCNGET